MGNRSTLLEKLHQRMAHRGKTNLVAENYSLGNQSRVVQACTAACGGAPAWARRLPERVKNAIFRTRNGSEARSPDFSGLRMRDGNTTNPMSQKHKRKRSFPKTLRRRRCPRLLHSLAGASALRSARMVVVRLWPDLPGGHLAPRHARAAAT